MLRASVLPCSIPPGHCECLRLPSGGGVPLGMHRMNPEYLDPDSSDRSVTANILVLQEPDEDENDEAEEDEGDNKEEDDEESDEGYSE